MSKVKFVEQVSENGAAYQVADMRNQFSGYVSQDRNGAGIDLNAIANAEKELAKISAGFEFWLDEDIKLLVQSHASWSEDPKNAELNGKLYRKAFDLQGQALTLGEPLVGDMASSLALLLEHVDRFAAPPVELVNAHINAIKAAMVRTQSEESDKLASELADTLREASQLLLDRHIPAEDQ